MFWSAILGTINKLAFSNEFQIIRFFSIDYILVIIDLNPKSDARTSQTLALNLKNLINFLNF